MQVRFLPESLEVVMRDGIEKFFNEIMIELGHCDWDLRWQEHDAYCWKSKKLIDICPMDNELECKQMVLHEIAHIEEDPGFGNRHTLEFFNKLEELCHRFLGIGLSPHQRRFKSYYMPPSFNGQDTSLRNWRSRFNSSWW